MTMHDYRTLGRSGLIVSPLALGTMTFGTARWGSGDVFNDYVDAGGKFVDTADVYQIVGEVRRITAEAVQSPAHVALAWVIGRQGITSKLMGVSRASQMTENIAAIRVTLTPERPAALDAVSAANPRMLYSLFTPAMRKQVVFGGSDVRV